MDQDQDQNQSRDDRKLGAEQTSPGRGPQPETKRRRQETLNLLDSRKSTSREKPTPRRGPGIPQLEEMRRQEEEIERKSSLLSDDKNKTTLTLTPRKGLEQTIAGVNVQMDGSLSSPSSLTFPTQPPSNQRYAVNYTTNLPEESGMDGSFGFHSHNNTIARQTNETAWQKGLSPQPWNPQQFNFGLEQTNQQDHYQSEAFAGVNVQTDGSSSSSLQFPTQPPSNQINYITNLPEEAMRSYPFSLKNRAGESFGTENSASSGNLNLNLGYGPSSYPVFGEGSSSSQENIERSRMSGISEFNSLYAQRGVTVPISPPRRPSPPNQLQGSAFYPFPTIFLPGPSPPHQRQILVLNCRNPTYTPPGYRPCPQEPRPSPPHQHQILVLTCRNPTYPTPGYRPGPQEPRPSPVHHQPARAPSSQAFPQTEGRSDDGEGDDESVDLNLKL